MNKPFTVLRLNARTFPIKPDERNILAVTGAEIIEVEHPDECERLAEVDAVLIVSAYLHASTVKRLTRCRIISRIGTGTDKIDVEQASAQGIIVTNVPDFATQEVADHTLALLLSAARKLKYYEASLRAGRRPFDTENIHRLSTQTLGIIGFGHIGQAVAARAHAFGLRIIACDPCLTEATATTQGVTPAKMETVLTESDYLCLLCPLTPATRGILAMPELMKMKRSAVLINTGRGELVNERDLALALKTGVIAYAGLDVFGETNVFSPDGFSCDHPLFGLENVQLTPHVAANSREALDEAQTRAAQAVADVFGNKSPQNMINLKELKKKV